MAVALSSTDAAPVKSGAGASRAALIRPLRLAWSWRRVSSSLFCSAP